MASQQTATASVLSIVSTNNNSYATTEKRKRAKRDRGREEGLINRGLERKPRTCNDERFVTIVSKTSQRILCLMDDSPGIVEVPLREWVTEVSTIVDGVDKLSLIHI